MPSFPTFTPSTAIFPALTRVTEVSLACQSSIDPTPSGVTVVSTIPATGSPVQLVRTPDAGVPSAGVVSTGEVSVLLVSVSVEDIVTIFTPSTASIPALTLDMVVSVA